MKEEDENQWLEIPGFSRYQINRQSVMIISKMRHRQGYVIKSPVKAQLTDDNGKRFGMAVRRVLYAAINGINPRDIPLDVVIRSDEDGSVMAISRQDINKEITCSIALRRAKENVEDEYKESLRLINIILEGYRTQSYTRLVKEVYEKKAFVFNYLKKRFSLRNEDTLELVWSAVSELAIDNIIKKKCLVASLDYYLSKICISYMSKKREIDRMTKHIDCMDDWGMNAY